MIVRPVWFIELLQMLTLPEFKSMFWYQWFMVDWVSLFLWKIDEYQEIKVVFLWITLAVPTEVDSYHSLFPLEPLPPPNRIQKSSNFGYITSCYKAVNSKDDLPYCLRRIHGKEDKLSSFWSMLLRLRLLKYSCIYLFT